MVATIYPRRTRGLRPAAILRLALATVATLGGASAARADYCSLATTYTTAIRGPNFGTSGATAGCGGARTGNADQGTGNTFANSTTDPVRYTNNTATSTAFGSNNAGNATQGRATATSNLADATLHAFGTSTADASGAAGARWSDQLFFTNTTGQNQFFSVSWTVEGTASLNPDSVSGVDSRFLIGTENQGGISEGGFQYNLDASGNVTTYEFQDLGAFSSDYRVTGSGIDRMFTSTFGVAPGSHTVDVFANLNVDARGGSSADFGNTSYFSFGPMPTGVVYTSSSGLFATIPNASAAPEANAWAMMILGFGAVGGTLRRRRPSALRRKPA